MILKYHLNNIKIMLKLYWKYIKIIVLIIHWNLILFLTCAYLVWNSFSSLYIQQVSMFFHFSKDTL